MDFGNVFNVLHGVLAGIGEFGELFRKLLNEVLQPIVFGELALVS